MLTAPGPVAKAAARVATLPEQRWILAQPREVRQSYANHVLGRPDEALVAFTRATERAKRANTCVCTATVGTS